MKRSELLKSWNIQVPQNFEDSEVLHKELEEIIGEPLVTKSRMDEVNEKYKHATEQLETTTKEFERLKEIGGKYEDLNKEFENTKKLLNDKDQEYTKKIEEITLNNAIKETLLKNKAKNADLVMNLIKKDNLKSTENGILGLDEEIKRIKDSDGYLFDNGTAFNSAKTGIAEGTSTKKDLYGETAKDMSDAEWLQQYENQNKK